jgi:hypothetical protein
MLGTTSGLHLYLALPRTALFSEDICIAFKMYEFRQSFPRAEWRLFYGTARKLGTDRERNFLLLRTDRENQPRRVLQGKEG